MRLVATEVRRAAGVAVVAHGLHVVPGVLDELVGRRAVDGGEAVKVSAGDKSGVVVGRARHVVVGLSLDLALDALAVRGVADHGCAFGRGQRSETGLDRADDVRRIGRIVSMS